MNEIANNDNLHTANEVMLGLGIALWVGTILMGFCNCFVLRQICPAKFVSRYITYATFSKLYYITVLSIIVKNQLVIWNAFENSRTVVAEILEIAFGIGSICESAEWAYESTL